MGSEARARVGLWALLAAALLSFGQVFMTGDYPGPAVLGILIASGITVGVRRLGAGSITTSIASLLGLTWYLSFVFQAGRTFWSLPTPEALAAIGRSAVQALEQSRVDYAPVPIRPGYALLLVAALWVATTVGELATFRWRRPLIAVLIPIVLFCIAVVVGSGASSAILVALFLTALLTYLGLESSHRLRSWGRWVSPWGREKEAEPVSITGALARRLGASAVLLALISPLFLPALGDGLVSWRSGSGAGTGFGGGSGRIDPWVSIEPRLVEQQDRELFTVEAKSSDYWYVASLEVYDGRDWHEANDDRVPASGGRIESLFANVGPTKNLSQRLVSTALGGSALPAARTPGLVWKEEGDNEIVEGITFDPTSGSVEVGDIDEGDTFRIISEVPDIRFKDLADAEPSVPDPVYTMRMTELDPRVRTLLERWTAGATSPLERLLAVQDRLRRDFTYNLNPEQRRSDDYLTEFLLDVRSGYCQQFATAFALLAREMGMASRVSVGFLPGSKNTEGLWSVRGTDAHAWPEVYFDELGWIRFEPTPRSDSVAPSYTSPPLPGSDAHDGFSSENVQNPFSDTGSQRESGQLEDPGGSDPIGPDGRPLSENPAEGGVAGESAAENAEWKKTFTRISFTAAAIVLLFLIIVPGIKEVRIRRRYERASTPNDLTEAAFVQFQEDATELAEPRRAAESAASYAKRVAGAGRVTERSVLRLAALYEASAYAGSGVTSIQGTEAKRLAGQLRSQLWSNASWWERARRLFSPRTLTPALPRLPRPATANLPAGRGA
ncbi:MAG: transglutaminaseTgpA domain-containing protein [Actinomycetota bacterium]